jgi:hypothetical protein
MKCRLSCVRLLSVLGVAGSLFQARAEIEYWSASSGLRPDQASTNWTYHGESLSIQPAFYQDFMLVDTSANRRVSHFQSAGCLDITNNLTIEFKARLRDRNACSEVISPASVFFGLGNGLGGVLYLGHDDVWLAGGNNTRGAGTTSVDTDNFFHTYRIELAGATAGSAINVFYDGGINPLFTGSVLMDAALNGTEERIGFGDNTREDSGASKWDYLWHNARCVPIDAVPEPATATLLIAGGAFLVARRHRREQA